MGPMRLRQGLVLMLVCAAGALAGGEPAAACGCGEVHGPLVASGVSPRGVRWNIRAQLEGRVAIAVDFSMEPPAYDDVGYGTEFPYPVTKRFTFTANAGSGLDRYGEQDVSGVTARRVTRVVITLSDGSRVVTRPRLARRAAYRRHRWLRSLRFYDAFLPSPASPVTAVARDARGRVVDRIRLPQ
jgi:hypothetical protein